MTSNGLCTQKFLPKWSISVLKTIWWMEGWPIHDIVSCMGS